MRPLPPAFLTLPPPGDRTARGLQRKVRLLAVRTLVTSIPGAYARAVSRGLREDGPGTLARIGAPDVLPRLLCAAAGSAPAGDVAALDAEPSRSVPIGPGVHLALEDPFPLAHLEAHPDKDGNALDLGGRPPEAWVTALADAYSVVAAMLPEWDAGIRPVACRRVVPVGWDERQHRSASFREAPGQAYLSLHPDPMTLAEAIVHEGQHSALNLLSWFDPLLRNPPDERVTSPVRPDPRPLLGVLLAAHAFVPVAALHLRLADAAHPWTRSDRFRARRAEVLRANEDALATLEAKARPTAAGARVLAELRAVQDAVAAATDGIP